MTKKKSQSRPGSGPPDHLSDEDRRLWEHTAKSLQPVRNLKDRMVFSKADHEDGKALFAPSAANSAGGGKPANEQLSRARTASRPNIARAPKPVVPPIADFDPKAARKLRSGRSRIEARIDLHGMRQNEAHSALRAFLWSAHRRGAKWVLVITGKGARSRGKPEHAEDVLFGMRSERGVLRQNVPRWLSEPDLRAIVVSFQTAAFQHGGEGALYVELRASPSGGRSA